MSTNQPFVISFTDLRESEKNLAGGKGFILAKLYIEKFPVPDGFIITPYAFIDDNLVENAWTCIKEQIIHLKEQNIGHYFAVRSSALVEDSTQASFGGQFETVLNIKTESDLKNAILKVRKSRSSERVISYSKAKGIDIKHEMAVIIQIMIEPMISGVLFTCDPVTGSRTRMVGNLHHGIGEQLVSGEVNAVEFSIERINRIYNGPLVFKKFAMKLFKLSVKIEKKLGFPQDIEWGIEKNKVFILQSRPITTFLDYDPITAVWNSTFKGDFLWAYTMVGEVHPEIVTPSTYTVWQALYSLGVGDIKTIGNINGRLYANLSLLNTLYRKIMRKSKEESLKDIKLELGKIPDQMTDIPVLPKKTREIIFDILPTAIKVRTKQRGLKRNHKKIIATAFDRIKTLENQIQNTSDEQILLDIYTKKVNPLFFDIVQLLAAVNDTYFHPFKKLKSEMEEEMGEEYVNTLVSSLGSGSGELAGLGPFFGLSQVDQGKLTREEYIKLYGHRCSNENELAEPRPFEKPNWFDTQYADYKKSSINVEELMERRKAAYEEIWSDIRLKYPKKSKNWRKRLDKILDIQSLRETIRTELTRSIGLIRIFFLKVGELKGIGNKVFYLTEDELLNVLKGEISSIAFLDIRMKAYDELRTFPPFPYFIRGRFDPKIWLKNPNPNYEYFDANSSTDMAYKHGDEITGFPGSAGIVEGKIRFLKSPDDSNQLLDGEILLASTTNIGWTTIFTRCKAIITDVGAPLSHAAIVARELGIPAVVGCGNATIRLKTGDKVFLDGNKGIIRILERM